MIKTEFKVGQILDALNAIAPFAYQASYDNSGLIVGSKSQVVTQALVCLDVTSKILYEAIEKQCDLIIAHHPLIFGGIKQINPDNDQGKCLQLAMQHGIAIIAFHTNFDHVLPGVSGRMAKMLGLTNIQVLTNQASTLERLTYFVPEESHEVVLEAVFQAGAGAIGNYINCSSSNSTEGTFTPVNGANPAIGLLNERTKVSERQVDVLVDSYNSSQIIRALRAAHPYEEVAYFLSPLKNANGQVGAGAVGEFDAPMATSEFLELVAEIFKTISFGYTTIKGETISRVAVCGGSGISLLGAAKESGAQAFVTADVKYHDFFEAGEDLMICNIGHYESEAHVPQAILEELREKMPTFAVLLALTSTNPINYYVHRNHLD